MSIGNNVHLQDGVVVGLENNSDKPTVIGDDVVVGANAVLHACTLRGRNVIGAGAQVWLSATLEKHYSGKCLCLLASSDIIVAFPCHRSWMAPWSRPTRLLPRGPW